MILSELQITYSGLRQGTISRPSYKSSSASSSPFNSVVWSISLNTPLWSSSIQSYSTRLMYCLRCPYWTNFIFNSRYMPPGRLATSSTFIQHVSKVIEKLLKAAKLWLLIYFTEWSIPIQPHSLNIYWHNWWHFWIGIVVWKISHFASSCPYIWATPTWPYCTARVQAHIKQHLYPRVYDKIKFNLKSAILWKFIQILSGFSMVVLFNVPTSRLEWTGCSFFYLELIAFNNLDLLPSIAVPVVK